VLNIERKIEAKARSLFTSLPFAGITRSRFNGFDLSPLFGAPLFLKSKVKLQNLFREKQAQNSFASPSKKN